MDERLPTAMRTYVFGVLGVFLVVVPWTAVWDRAALALLPSPIGWWVWSGWARGVVSGLGVLDLVMAGREGGLLRRLLRRPSGDRSAAG